MTVVLKKVEHFSREEIRSLLAENCTLLDQSLKLLGGELGLRGETLWDLLGIDSHKRLVLIGIELKYSNNLLYQLVKRLDWAWEHIEIINKMYSSFEIDCTRLPRVIMLAPYYAHFFKKGINYLTSQLNIALFTYSYLESTGERGILIEQVEERPRYMQGLRGNSSNLKNVDASQIAKVTTEEIMEFLT